MPFSVKVSAADKADAATAPVSASGSAANPQATSLGDTFAALMQACLPATQSTAKAVGGQGAKPSQQTDLFNSPTRTRKGAADASDPATMPLLVAQLPVPVVLPGMSVDTSQVSDQDTPDGAKSSSRANVDAGQPIATNPSTDAAVDQPAGANASGPTNGTSQSVQELVRALSSSADAGEPVATAPTLRHPAAQAPTSQQPALQVTAHTASLSSPSVPAHALHAALPAGGVTAASVDSAPAIQRTAGQKQYARMDARGSLLSTSSTFASAPSTSTREALSSTVTPQASAASAAAWLVLPATGSDAQASLTSTTMLTGYAGQGASAVVPTAQAAVGDASSESQDDADGGTPAERKSSQGAPRTGTSLTEGDSRVGMSGWVGTTGTHSDPAAQRTGLEAPEARSGLTNLSLDRIAAESSARRLTNALRSDMSFGVQTAAFGKVNIQATLHGDQLLSQISLEHAHGNASTLAAHMPLLEFTLGEKYKLNATVTVQNSGTAMSGGSQESPTQGNRQQNTGPSPQKLMPAGGVMPTTTVSPERRQTQERPAPAADRLDLVI